MLTLEENWVNLRGIKILSLLNLVPIKIEIGADGGKIKRQPSKIKLLIWRIFFFVWLLHSSYIFVRLVQSILQPEKYFRWDHFVVHFPTVCTYGALFIHGFCLFVTNPTECVLIFNYIFMKRQDPLEKRMAKAKQLKNDDGQIKRGNTNEKKPTEGRKRKIFGIELELKSVSHSNFDLNSDTNPHQRRRQESAKPSQVRIKLEPDSSVRPLLSWPPKYSLDELVARTLTLPAVSIVFGGTAIYAIDPSRCQLLYSALPPDYQNWYSFFSLLVVEAFSLTMMLVNTYFAAFLQLMFFSKCQAEFKQLNLQLRNLKDKFQNGSLGIRNGRVNEEQDAEREILTLCQILEEMKELVVFIEIFNRCFPFCIFSMKIAVLNSATLYYFFSIRHFNEFPFIAAFCTYLAVAMTLVYCVTYQHAFSIPEKTEELKAEFLLTAQTLTSTSAQESSSNISSLNLNKNTMKELDREIKGIQDIMIKVGGFHQMERQSTPNFIDFVVKNVVNLLVSFP